MMWEKFYFDSKKDHLFLNHFYIHLQKKIKFAAMKKIILLLVWSLLFVECSHKDDVSETIMEPTTILETKAPTLDFYGLSNKSASNIQVNDYVKVIVDITRLKGADIIQVKPESISATYHDILNTDYELYTASETNLGEYLKRESLVFFEGKNVFYIKPLVSGTFQIKLEEKSKTFRFEDPIVFTAVSITTSSTTGMGGNCGLSRWRHRDFWFKIDAGSQIYDNLLNEANATYSYETSYDNNSLSGDLEINKNLKIINTRSECSNNPALPPIISSIIIKKTIDNKTEIVAIYYNISIQ